MMATVNGNSSDAAEDREIFEKLAQLQGVYNQMFELRTLLPDKLVSPTRAILQASNRSPPEKLAAQLKGAAVAGSKDIQRFKLNYHSDAMRDLFQTVNAAEIPQGQDAWFTDYITLLEDITAKETQGKTGTSNKQSMATDETLSGRDVIKRFREAHPDVEISIQDETLGLPLGLIASPFNFRVDRAEDRGNQGYSVEVEEDNKQTQLAKEVIRYVQAKHNDESLSALLSLLASYINARTQRCTKCNQIFDAALQYPLARERPPSKSDEWPVKWKVIHQSCAT